jgi:transcription antitermination factor NusG
MITSKASWHAVYTYPNLERKIHAALVKQTVVAYLPLQKVARQWSDRIKEILVPLFPNYLFVRILDRERGNVLQVPGVARFVAFEGQPAILSDDEIETIRKLEHTPLERESPLLSGDRVQIVQGPLVGLEGILFQKKGKQRFGVRLHGLRQVLSLDIGVGFLKKL